MLWLGHFVSIVCNVHFVLIKIFFLPFSLGRSGEKGNLGMPQFPGQGCSFHSFRTNTYKLSFMESPSGIKVRICSCSCFFVAENADIDVNTNC